MYIAASKPNLTEREGEKKGGPLAPHNTTLKPYLGRIFAFATTFSRKVRTSVSAFFTCIDVPCFPAYFYLVRQIGGERQRRNSI